MKCPWCKAEINPAEDALERGCISKQEADRRCKEGLEFIEAKNAKEDNYWKNPLRKQLLELHNQALAIALTKELFEDWRANHAPEFLKDSMKDKEFVFMSAPIPFPLIDSEKDKAATKAAEDMGLGYTWQEKFKKIGELMAEPGMIVEMPSPPKRSWWTRLKDYACQPMRHPFGMPPKSEVKCECSIDYDRIKSIVGKAIEAAIVDGNSIGDESEEHH